MASINQRPAFNSPPPVSILDDAAIGNLFLHRIPRLPIRGRSAADALPCRCECTGRLFLKAALAFPLPRRFGSSSVSILLQGSGGTLRDGTDVSAPLVMTFDVRPHNHVPSLSSSTTSPQVLQGSGPSTCSTSRPQVPAPSRLKPSALSFFQTRLRCIFQSSLLPTAACRSHRRACRGHCNPDDDGGSAFGGVSTSSPLAFAIEVQAGNHPPHFVHSSRAYSFGVSSSTSFSSCCEKHRPRAARPSARAACRRSKRFRQLRFVFAVEPIPFLTALAIAWQYHSLPVASLLSFESLMMRLEQ